MKRTLSVLLALVSVLGSAESDAQQLATAVRADIAAKLRPLGSPSAVDAFRPAQNQIVRSRNGSPNVSNIRLTQFELPDSLATPTTPAPLPRNDLNPSLPPSTALPNAGLPSSSLPNTATLLPTSPRQLPSQPPAISNQIPQASTLPPPSSPSVSQALPSNDYAPIAPPSLSNNQGFATLGNCSAVSRPPTYQAWMAGGCTPINYVPTTSTPAFTGPAAQLPAVASPSFTNPNPVLPAAPGTNVPGALFTLGQQAFPVQLGQGWYGQPKAFVPGQTFRNWIRYLSP
ncbi:MAG: hypothetical protein AAF664_19320 [Planctomycetota bacterium]